MFRKNPVYELQLNYLGEVHPHRWWHYLLILIALLFASISLWRGFDFNIPNIIYGQNGNYSQQLKSVANIVPILVQIMAIPILSVYWIFQFRIMQSAFHLANHNWQENAPETLVGSVSQRTIIFAKIRAILSHHRIFLILICLALLGLSWATSQFLLFWSSNERGILQYVGILRTGFSVLGFPTSGRVLDIPIMGIALLILTFTNSLLSTNIGLWANNRFHSIAIRLLLVAVIFSVFMSLYILPRTPTWRCYRYDMPAEFNCPEKLLQARIIESIQEISLSFVDGGASMVTGLRGCGGISFQFGSYQGRHLLAIIATIIAQLTLSAFFLRRTIQQSSKKKK